MHDPEWALSSLFHQEKRHGNPIATSKALMETVERQWDEKALTETLRFLNLPHEPLSLRDQPLAPEMLFQLAYDAVVKLYWYRLRHSWGWKATLYRGLSMVFGLGIGPIQKIDRNGLIFPVYSFPTCPVIKAYQGELKSCGESCRERSRLGVFTNPLITRVLRYYHPGLKLRLHEFRSSESGPCLYRIVMDHH